MNHAAHIETLPIDALVPYARNARTHSPQQVAQIAASIREFGFTNPVLIDAEGGIVAGHGRVMAAKSLGVGSVPCLRVDWLTDAQRRAYVLADNQLALQAGWDDELLAGELRALQAEGFDLALTGFDAAEQTGRCCYAMELSPQYVDVAVRRWQQFTGKRAVLEATGAAFPEAAA